MDFAFAPGGDAYDATVRQLLHDRKITGSFDTTLIHDPTHIKDVSAFIKKVDTSVTAPPVGDLLIGSHANDRGWLKIDLDGGADLNVTYKLLKDVLANPSRLAKVKIPPRLYTKPDKTNAPIKVHMKGCRIGLTPKLVDTLKQVFGGVVPVTACKGFHLVQHWPRHGTFEYLDYSLRALSKTTLTRAQVIDGLKKAKHEFFDATKIPDDIWDLWVPASLTKDRQDLTFSVKLGRTISRRTTLPATGQYRHDVVSYPLTILSPGPADKKLSGVLPALNRLPEFQPAWGFPMYEQFGYASPKDFFDGLDWTPTVSTDRIVWNGSRHEYTMVIPITDPVPTIKTVRRRKRVVFGKLFYNFYPVAGSRDSAINELLETNSDLFYTTP